MTPSNLVILIAFVTFMLGMAGVAIFGPPEQQQGQIGALGWLVRILVGLAVAHTCVGIYGAIERMHEFNELNNAGHAADLSSGVMNIMVFGGVLLAFAALLHLLIPRSEQRRES